MAERDLLDIMKGLLIAKAEAVAARYIIVSRYMNDQTEMQWRSLCVACVQDVAADRTRRAIAMDYLRRADEAERCTKCQDRPGHDGLGRTCKHCGGTGYKK